MKYTVSEIHRTHIKVCEKKGIDPVGFFGFAIRMRKFKEGGMTFKEIMETPQKKNTHTFKNSLKSKCEFFGLNYNSTYWKIKSKGMTFEQIVALENKNSKKHLQKSDT